MAQDESIPMMLFKYEIGHRYGIDFQGREVATYNYNRSGHHITIALPNMTAREEKELRFGPPQFALTIRDGIIFLLSKFGEMPWMDMPYQWWLNPPALRMMPSTSANDRVLVSVIGVDSTTSRVRTLRAVTLPSALSVALCSAIRHQARATWKGAAFHDRQLGKIYRRLSTADLLAQAAVMSEGTEVDQNEASFGQRLTIGTATAGHVYVPYPDVNSGIVPNTFNVKEFMAFHHQSAISVAAEDDPDGIDIERNARLGALKAQEVTVDGAPYKLWVVQPGYYSEDFGLELPE